MSEQDRHCLELAGTLPVANIGDAMERLNVVDSGIRTVWPGARIVGRAFTVMTAGGDNKAIHEALEHVGPGDVLVVNGQGATHRALIGELIAGRAAAKGVVGFVIDGAIRDVRDLEEMGFPVFARAVTPAGPYRNGPGYHQKPVAIGGVVVNPGDLVVADDDGVAVVPRDAEAGVIARAIAKHEQELAQRVGIPAPSVI
jgi:RraA family protein